MSQDEPDNVILRMLRDIRAEIGDVRAEMATKNDVAELRSEMHSLRADVASDMLTLRRDVGDQIAGLRRQVVEYHSSVIGHGMLISEIDAHVRRVEQHLNLPAIEPH